MRAIAHRARHPRRARAHTHGVHPTPPNTRRRVIILVKAGSPVDQTIDLLMQHMEPGDIIIDGGNEWCVAWACLSVLGPDRI